MDYQTAKTIAEDLGLIVDDAPVGQRHIDVRTEADGPHFSITLPTEDGPEAGAELGKSIGFAIKYLIPNPNAG
jgi:hypothetical protein